MDLLGLLRKKANQVCFTGFSFKGTQIVCQKKVHSMSISLVLFYVISFLPSCLFPPFNKSTYSLIVILQTAFLTKPSHQVFPLSLILLSHLVTVLLSIASSPYTCFSLLLISRAVSPSDSRNSITTLCFCRECLGAILPVLPSNDKDAEGLLKLRIAGCSE